MKLLTDHYKLKNNEWCMKFKFDTDTLSFSEVRRWFDEHFDKNEVWMGWRTDESTLTVFIGTEQAYVFSILRWG